MMRSSLAAAALVAATGALGGRVAADEPLRVTAGDLPGLVWSLGRSDCTGSDLERRQCRGIKVARATALRGKSFIAAGDASAIQPGADGRPVVRGCLACVQPTGGLYVVTRGNVSLDGGRVLGPIVGRGARGCDAAGARVDFTFRLDPAARWTRSGKTGVFVELAGFTMSGCEEAKLARTPPGPPPPPPPSRVTLDASDVKVAISAVEPEAQNCFERFGTDGIADAWLEIAPSGALAAVEVRGAFAGTPTGVCVADAVKKVRFPPFQRGPIRLHYPFTPR